MFEYLATLYFVAILWFNIHNPSFQRKTFELALLLFITYKNPLLGIVCAIIFIQETPVGVLSHVQPSSRFYVDEQLRPTSSNKLCAERQSGLPPQESLIGQMEKPYSQMPSKYTPF